MDMDSDVHIPGLNPRSAESEFLGMGPRNLPLKKVPLSSKVCFEMHQKNRIAWMNRGKGRWKIRTKPNTAKMLTEDIQTVGNTVPLTP